MVNLAAAGRDRVNPYPYPKLKGSLYPHVGVKKQGRKKFFASGGEHSNVKNKPLASFFFFFFIVFFSLHFSALDGAQGGRAKNAEILLAETCAWGGAKNRRKSYLSFTLLSSSLLFPFLLSLSLSLSLSSLLSLSFLLSSPLFLYQSSPPLSPYPLSVSSPSPPTSPKSVSPLPYPYIGGVVLHL